MFNKRLKLEKKIEKIKFTNFFDGYLILIKYNFILNEWVFIELKEYV